MQSATILSRQATKHTVPCSTGSDKSGPLRHDDAWVEMIKPKPEKQSARNIAPISTRSPLGYKETAKPYRVFQTINGQRWIAQYQRLPSSRPMPRQKVDKTTASETTVKSIDDALGIDSDMLRKPEKPTTTKRRPSSRLILSCQTGDKAQCGQKLSMKLKRRPSRDRLKRPIK